MAPSKSKSPLYLAGMVCLALVIALLRYLGGNPDPAITPADTSPVRAPIPSARTPSPSGSSTPVADRAPAATPPRGVGRSASTGEHAILRAFNQQQSDVLVQAVGIIKKILPDDSDGSRHQRLIVRLASGHTVLIAHNIDLAPRVPAREGDSIEFKGEYEYSEQGGVIHWTHHDPANRRPGGWLKLAGATYQ